ncbi:uncharacterized protein AB9X84_026745 [Acanthopagrus schlegelii]
MPFSVRFGVRLAYLTILLILPEQGRPQCYHPTPRAPGPTPPCCTGVSKARINEPIVSCLEQRQSTFRHCRMHAFILTTANKTDHCVDPAATWLPTRFERLGRRQICCRQL